MTDPVAHAPLAEAAPAAHSRILGVGGARPERHVTNDEIAEPIDSSDEWIRQRTGIVTRVRADADTQVADLAEAAARAALDAAGLTGADIDAVIVSTVTFPYITGSCAALVADRIGATPAAAFDIGAACAGYCYGIGLADSLVRSGTARHVLVVGAEKLSDWIDPTDRSISFLLGDGAGAAVVGPSDHPGISPTVWGSDGGRWDTIHMTHSLLDVRDGAGLPTLRQAGPSVYRWAVWDMAKVARRALDAAGVEAEDLAAFVPHQANMRIIDEFAKQLGLPDTVVIARDIAETGNTSAASIPLATERLLREHPSCSGGLALEIGFGAGLVYAAQVVELP